MRALFGLLSRADTFERICIIAAVRRSQTILRYPTISPPAKAARKVLRSAYVAFSALTVTISLPKCQNGLPPALYGVSLYMDMIPVAYSSSYSDTRTVMPRLMLARMFRRVAGGSVLWNHSSYVESARTA